MEPGDELLHSLQRGDENAWDKAFQLLYPIVFHAACHPLAALTPAEAEDVAIEILGELARKVGSVKDWQNLRCLAATMAGRRAISHKRRATAVKRGAGHVQSLEGLHEESGGTFEAAEQIVSRLQPGELRELSGLLQEAMAGLEPQVRELIHDFTANGTSYKELAVKYQMPIGTVGVQLARGLKKIRQVLAQKPKLLKEITLYLR